MADRQITKGSTSVLLEFPIGDTSDPNGGGMTGLVFGTSGLTAYYYRSGAASAVQINLLTMTAGTWTTAGFVAVDGTNLPGLYQLGIPDAALASGANRVMVMLKGAANMAPVIIDIELTNLDFYDGVRAGLTALPNAAAEAAGGLYTRGTGVGQIRQDANGRIDANAKAWIDGTIPAVNVTGVPKVDIVDWLGSAPDALSSGKIPADLKLWLTAAPAALSTNGYVQAMLLRWLTDNAGGTPNALASSRVDASVGAYPGNTAQTGDNYARLGAPAGASISADLAEIEGETDTLLAGVLITPGTGAGMLDVTSGVVKANLAQILGTALTETSGQIAAAFKKFFDKATPTGTINSIPDAVAGASSGLALVGSNVGAATSVSGAVGSVSGAVGSVTGAVGSVTGAVGSVTGNVGGNVVGSVASVTAGVTVTTNNDKTGYGLSAAAVQAVWDALTSALTTAGSIGKLLVDNINATISSRLASASISLSGGAVTVGTNNDKTGYSLTVTPPTAAQISTQVWNEPIPGTFAEGTAGEELSDVASVTDPWGTALPGAYGSGTAGNLIGNNVNATISSRSSHTAADVWAVGTRSLTTFGTLVADVVTAVWAAGARTLTLASDSSGVTTLLSRLTSGRATNLDNLDAAVSTRLATSGYTVPPAASTIASAVLTLTDGVETGITPQQALRLILAANAGKLSGAGTTTITIRDAADTKNRIVATVDASGDRSAVTYDLT